MIMQKILPFFTLISFLTINPAAITWKLHHDGRFGDHLWIYMQAKWLSEKYDIPLLLRSYTYFNQLQLYQEDLKLDEVDKTQFKETLLVNNEEALTSLKHKPVLIQLVWSSAIKRSQMLNNKEFIQKIKKLIQPIKPINMIELSNNKDAITVALHVRKGGGWDKPLLSDPEYNDVQFRPKEYADVKYPLKFPSDEYYIDQLKTLSNQFPQKKLYVFIFTDYPKAEKIAQKYEKKLQDSRFIFDYRKEGNHYNTNVLKDFFSIIHFDCLIRPVSHFSYLAQILGNHKIVISPKKYIWQGNKLIITEVYIKKKNY